MTRDELREGYIGLMRDLYDADFYFERLENLYLTRRLISPGLAMSIGANIRGRNGSHSPSMPCARLVCLYG